MEVLLRSLYGITAVMAVRGGNGGASAIPLRIGPTSGGTAEVLFEHVQSCRRATAKVRDVDSFPRHYGDQ